MSLLRRIAGLRCPSCRALVPVGIFQTLRWRGVHAPDRLFVICDQCQTALRLKQKTAPRLLAAIGFFFALMVGVFAVAFGLAQVPVFLSAQNELNGLGMMLLLVAFVVGALQIYRIYGVEEAVDVA
ncbi:hypothetical protein [Nereida sp. MMG025]|uniref:hypothetical protein n=1 Tax=Nereida sp. MMG025 TaxID=2909981 RepID=UPI001F3BAC12|nr:hypothetical protein [Nereida sp. MMG025]MCF6445283.1 hypothetical protein [Nereida sp. MMG025]